MPAIAEKIYANLMKDPDLDIPNGLTREDVARTEAEQRERQYLNNAVALSLVKEELEESIDTIYNNLGGEPYYKLLPEHNLIYDNLYLEAQQYIDALDKASKDPDTYGDNLSELVQNIFNGLQSHYHKEHGGQGLEYGGKGSNKKILDSLTKQWDDVHTHVLKNDDHMKELMGYDNTPHQSKIHIHDLIKYLNPDSKITKPKSSQGESKKGVGTLQQDIDTAQKAHKEYYGELTDEKPEDLDTENFNREDVPYHVQTIGGKSHQVAMKYGLADANGMLNKKGHGLINFAKENGLSTTGSFQPKAIKYTKDKKYVLSEKSLQGLVDFYETATDKKVASEDHGIKDAPIPKGLQTAPSKADLPKSEQESFEETLMEQVDPEEVQKLKDLLPGGKKKTPTVGAGDKEKLLAQADDAGLIDYIHEVVEGHGEDNPYHTKGDTVSKLQEMKNLKEYLGKMHNKQKVAKQTEEDKQQKAEEAQAAKEEAQEAKEKALREKEELKAKMQKQKEMQAEAKVMPEHSEGEDVNLHAEEMLAHVKKYEKYLSGAQKKEMAKKINNLFDKNKAPKSFKGKAANKKEVDKAIKDIGGIDNVGSDKHMEQIQFDKEHKQNIEEHHGKLHSKEGAASKQAAFETGDHHATTNFDEDGNVTGHSTSSHNAEGKTTAGKSKDEGYSSGGHDGIHHLNHPMNPAQEETFNQYKEAMKTGDTEAADAYKQDLIDSGIAESSFETEDKGKYPDPEVAKKKLAEGYVFNEETRHWILKENLEGAQGSMGPHDAEIHSSSSTNEAGQAFALNSDGTPHKGNFMVSQAGVHKLGDDHATNVSNVPKMGGMTMNQTKANTLGNSIANSSYGKLHEPGGVTKLKGALHEKGSMGALFSGGSGGLLHGSGIEHSKNIGHKKPAYAKAQQKKKAETIDAAKVIGKYAALGYSPQVAKFMGKVGKNLTNKIKQIKQAKAPGGDTEIKKSLNEFSEFIRKTKV